MKLLFDENLSPRLRDALGPLYPGSRHVHECGLGASNDSEIWEFAAHEGFVIVSKDSDFYHRAILYGTPPKVIWLRTGNCGTSAIEEILRESHARLRQFWGSKESTLVLARMTRER